MPEKRHKALRLNQDKELRMGEEGLKHPDIQEKFAEITVLLKDKEPVEQISAFITALFFHSLTCYGSIEFVRILNHLLDEALSDESIIEELEERISKYRKKGK